MAGGASDAGVLRDDDEELNLLQNKIGERVREVRRVRDDGGRPEGDGGFTGRCRNRPWLPADMRGSGKKFRSPRCGSSGEAKGDRERTPGAICRHSERSKRAGSNEGLREGASYCARRKRSPAWLTRGRRWPW
jgi:hypothetical protein